MCVVYIRRELYTRRGSFQLSLMSFTAHLCYLFLFSRNNKSGRGEKIAFVPPFVSAGVYTVRNELQSTMRRERLDGEKWEFGRPVGRTNVYADSAVANALVITNTENTGPREPALPYRRDR